MKTALLAHLTTVHTRRDTRIFLKQVQTLQAAFPDESLVLIVADGEGDEGNPGRPKVVDLGALPAGRIRRMWMGSWGALRHIRRMRPATVHFHDPELIPLGFLLKLAGHRIIYDVHEDLPRQIFNKYWVPRLLRYPMGLGAGALEWLGGRVFDAIVPATPTIAARFSPRRTVLIQNFPIQAELIGLDSSTYGARPPDFAYVGGLAAIRGAREMVAAAGLLEDHSEARLHLAGSFERAALEAEMATMSGWRAVTWHGFLGRKEIAELLGSVRAGLVVLNPTRNYQDSLPIKMFEYMAAGLPVIASDFPLWWRIVSEARCGLLVDPRSPQAIAGAMRWILEHPTEAARMGARGRQAVVERFNWECEGAHLVDLYRTLIPG